MDLGLPHSTVVTDELSQTLGHFTFTPPSSINNINMHFITVLLQSKCYPASINRSALIISI